jgi:hypothetical protein
MKNDPEFEVDILADHTKEVLDWAFVQVTLIWANVVSILKPPFWVDRKKRH